MSSTRINWSRSRSAARKPGASWKIWRAAVMMPAGSKDSGIRRSRTSRYSAYRAAAAVKSGRLQRRLGMAFEEFLEDEVLFRPGQQLRGTRQGKDARGFGPSDQVEGVGRPG